jgi:hypothetical protein
MVVAVGLTVVEPVAFAEVKVPGVMAMLVAPEVDQDSVLLEPELTVVGLAVKELIVGAPGLPTVTVTLTLGVRVEAELVAVRV